MFSPDDPLLVPYRQLQRTFGASATVVAAYVDQDLMTHEGMRQLEQICNRIEGLPGVAAVLSLRSPLGDAIIDDGHVLAEPLRALMQGYTLGADGRTTAVVVMLKPEHAAKVPRTKTIRQLRDIVQPLPEGTIAGEAVMVVDGFRYIEDDGRRLGVTSTILLTVTIALCFRSLRWVVIPIAVVQLTIILTRALLTWLQFRLSMVSSMFTAIITVVGVATVVHVIVRFREGRELGLTPADALQRAGTLLALPILWACATDAVGFASLLIARVGPIQDFGLMMATGAMMVIVSVALVVPGLALWGRMDPDPQRAWGEARLDHGLRHVLTWVERWPKTIGAITMFVALTLAAGSFRIDVETDFTKNFRRESPVVQAYQFVEQRLGGAGVWDIILPAPDTLDWPYLSRVRKLEEHLRREVPGLTKILSIADAVQASAPFDLDGVRFAAVQRTMAATAMKFMRKQMPGIFPALYGIDPDSDEKRYFRIMLRSRERQSSGEKRALIAKVRRICREHFPEARVTGYFVLLANLIDSMIRDQWITFAVASAGIGVMMLIAFRSPLLALIALVPNILPVVMVTGVMGWLNLKINMGAAMIAAVSIGLAVDSSIHYITFYRRALADGKSVNEALDIVQQTVGRAMVFSTLALIVGFTSLCQSQFVPTIYFGALVSLSMIGGLAGNLVILPLLLKVAGKS